MPSQKKIVIFLALSVILLIVFLPSYIKYHRLAVRNANLRKQIEEIKAVNIKLKEESNLLQNDTFYMESVARERTGVAKEGEVVYRIVPDNKK